MESAIQVQTLDDAVCVSLYVHALEKGINPSLLSLIIIEEQIGLFSFGMATNVGEEKLNSNQLYST